MDWFLSLYMVSDLVTEIILKGSYQRDDSLPLISSWPLTLPTQSALNSHNNLWEVLETPNRD